MQFRLTALTALAVATLAAANGPQNQCNVGELRCCNSVQPANSATASALLRGLNVVVGDATALVGITCSAPSAIGIAGNSCTTQPTCCTNNSFNGIVALGCTPINANV